MACEPSAPNVEATRPKSLPASCIPPQKSLMADVMGSRRGTSVRARLWERHSVWVAALSLAAWCVALLADCTELAA